MHERIEVTGAEQAPQSEPHDRVLESPWASRLVTALIGAALGAALVFLVTAPESRTETPTTPADLTLPPPAAVAVDPAPPPPEPTLAELVPGLETDLVSFGYTTGGTPIVLRWERDSTEPAALNIPFGSPISDISNQWIASVVDQRYGPSSNLHVGNAVYQEVVATDVRGAVWSVDEAGRLIWAEQSAGETTVRDASFMGAVGGKHLVVPSRPTVQSFRLAVPEDATPVWLDGDRLTIASSGSLMSLRADGTTAASLESAAMVTATDGLAVARIDGVMTLIDTDLATRGVLPVDHDDCREARFAPASSESLRIAVLCEDPGVAPTVEVIDIIDVGQEVLGFKTVTSVDIADAGPMAWIDGDRFLAITQPDPRSRPRSSVVIIDSETDRITELTWRGVIFEVLGVR